MTACPFCDAPLPIDATAPAVPSARLGRAARMAFGGAAAVAMTVAGCDGRETIAAAYGGPPLPPALADGGTLVTVTPPEPGSETPDAATLTTTADAATPDAAADAATPAASKKPPPPKATATARPHPPGNTNKPYGAPPADGYDVFDV